MTTEDIGKIIAWLFLAGLLGFAVKFAVMGWS